MKEDNILSDMTVALFLDFEVPIVRREGIMVYTGFWINSILKKGVNIEIWLFAANKPNFVEAFSEELDRYKGQIKIFTERDGSTRQRGNMINYFKSKVWKRISVILCKCGINRVGEWFYKTSINHDILYEESCYDMGLTFENLSKADCAYVPFPLLKQALSISIPTVVQVHDLFTLSFRALFNREHFPRANYNKSNRKLCKIMNQYAKRKACFVTSTEYTRDNQLLPYIKEAKAEMCSTIMFPPLISLFNNTNVISREIFMNRFGISGKYIAFPSQNRPNKNVILLLKAIKELRDKGMDYTLVTTGRMSDCNSTLMFCRENPGLVKEIGSISTEELYCLYLYSECVAGPNIVEGMGMSGQCLEAMAVGVPVTHGKTYGAEESLSKVGLSMEKAKLYWFDLDDYKALANNIIEISKNRNTVIQEQKCVVEAFFKRTWEDVAEDYMDLFLSLINDSNNDMRE